MSAPPVHAGARIWLRLKIDELEALQQALAQPPQGLRAESATNADARDLLRRAQVVSDVMLPWLGYLAAPYDLERKTEGKP